MRKSHSLQIKKERLRLKEQRLQAKKHRRHMRIRNAKHKKAQQKIRQKQVSHSGVSFITMLATTLQSLGFIVKDIAISLRSALHLFALDIVYVWHVLVTGFKNKVAAIKRFISQKITNLSNQKKQRKEHKESMKKNTALKGRGPRKITTLKTKKKGAKRKIWKIIIGIVFALGLLLLGLILIWFSSLEIPSVQNFENRKISNSTKIFDKTGEVLLYDIHDDIRRTVVGFEDINQNAKDAIVAIEDHTFYEHDGVVWKSTLRGLLQTISSKAGLTNQGTAGGSTLTQQVVKNTLLNRDKVISRKVKEWVLAYKIEDKLSKDEILEIYLNEAPYGGTVYGIQEASKRFFGIDAADLNVAQSAYLAAIPNLPTFYSPYGPNKDKLDIRQQTVLREMKRYGFISDSEYESAQQEVVEFLPEEEGYAKSLHFVQYVRAQLEETYGVDIVENGGLQVTTTLDYELQQKAEEIIKEHIEEVEEPFDASNAALVAIESTTGQILTMVGSRDYFDTEEFDGNFNVAISPRQPGSSFKPFAYATAFEKGYYPESSIFDTETQFNARCDAFDTTSADGCYSPNNYDFRFKGPLSFKDALAQSRNIPAIKVNYLAGVNNVIQKARDLGITSLNKSANFYGLGLVLGGGEVSLLEMTGAYATLANEGIHNKPTAILEVKDLEGNILEKFQSDEERAVDQNAARMVNRILSDNVARTPLFGSQSFLYFGERDVAGKTGTTNDNRDAWLIGYTPDVAVGVWTGNNDNSPMKKGSSISGKPWRKYMDEVIKNYSARSFANYELPENFQTLPNMIRGDWYGGTTVYIDSVSGKLATEFTPEETKIAVPQPDPHTILHWIDKNNPTVRNDARSDPQYRNWEASVQQYTQANLSQLLDIDIDLPTEYDDVHTADGIIEISDPFTIEVEGLKDDEPYEINEMITFELDFDGRSNRDIERVQYFVNNAFVSTDESAPFVQAILPETLQYFEEENLLRIIAEDEDGVKVTKEVTFLLEI